jgi:hypothetical protein
MMTVAVEQGGSTFRAGTPMKLFNAHYYSGAGNFQGRAYDIAPDGRRFLMMKVDAGPPTDIGIVLNWSDELKRLIPANK